MFFGSILPFFKEYELIADYAYPQYNVSEE